MWSSRDGSALSRAFVTLACAAAIVLAGATSGNAAWTHGPEGGYEVYYWNGAMKFRYDNTIRVWEHYSTIRSTWCTLSAWGQSSDFVGDESWHPIGYGLQFKYNPTYDYGYYGRGGHYRFYYRYLYGQWYTSGYGGGWAALTTDMISAQFLVDAMGGPGHQTGQSWLDPNVLKFRYVQDLDVGYFYRYDTLRFDYNYATGQWRHADDEYGWYPLGPDKQKAFWVTDKQYHNIKNGFDYQYNWYYDQGRWRITDTDQAQDRFAYNYETGRWAHRGPVGGWFVLAAQHAPPEFIGDGAYHMLGWWHYKYYRASDDAYWSRDGAPSGDRFHYWYGTGFWTHRGYGGSWEDMGQVGVLSAFFIGGAVARDLGGAIDGPHWWYWYDYNADKGTWAENGDHARFEYRYTFGEWKHTGNSSGFNPLGHAGMSASFPGNGQWHDLGNGFSYVWLWNWNNIAGNNKGYWYQSGGYDRYWYDYDQEYWAYYDGDELVWIDGPVRSTGVYNPGEP